FATIKAHATVKVSVTVKTPAKTSASYVLAAKAHADHAIGGEEPRDGNVKITGTALSDTVPATFQPGGRTGAIGCGDTISSGTFQSGEDTLQLGAALGCAHSKVALTISASGKTIDLQEFKIVGAATDQILGSVGILVKQGADNVTIIGGATGSKSGLEYFDYCLMD